jgi:hypothetical protein
MNILSWFSFRDLRLLGNFCIHRHRRIRRWWWVSDGQRSSFVCYPLFILLVTPSDPLWWCDGVVADIPPDSSSPTAVLESALLAEAVPTSLMATPRVSCWFFYPNGIFRQLAVGVRRFGVPIAWPGTGAGDGVPSRWIRGGDQRSRSNQQLCSRSYSLLQPLPSAYNSSNHSPVPCTSYVCNHNMKRRIQQYICQAHPGMLQSRSGPRSPPPSSPPVTLPDGLELRWANAWGSGRNGLVVVGKEDGRSISLQTCSRSKTGTFHSEPGQR